jgi:serine/threonine-protein kinase
MSKPSVMQRLRERKVVQWTAAYGVVALGIMEFLEGFGPRWGVPESALQRVDVVLIIGLGATIVVAWFHGERGRQRVGALEVGALGLVLLAGSFLASRIGDGESLPPPPSLDLGLAVIPFEDLSPGEEDSYFARTMHEELTAVLGRELPTVVIAGPAMRRYQDSELGPTEIAAELGVRYALTGSVRLVDDNVRLTVTLIDRRRSPLWTEAYDAELDPRRMLEVQKRIAAEVASTLVLEIREAEIAATLGEGGSAAYVPYLQAMDRLRGVQGLGRFDAEADRVLAIDLLAEATRLDPTFVPALANHSIQLMQWVNNGVGPMTMAGAQIDSIHALALESAERANEVAPGDPTALAALASYRYFVDRDYPAAIEVAGEALAADPNHYDATFIRAGSYRRLGLLGQSATWLEALIRLDPRNSGLRYELIRTLTGDRRFDEAMEAIELTESQLPGQQWTLRSELSALAGDTAGIRRAAESCSPPGCGAAQLNAAMYLGARGQRTEPMGPIIEALIAEITGDAERADALYRRATDSLEALVDLEGEWCPGSLCPNRIGQGQQLALARAKLGDTERAREALRESKRLTDIEPRDLWAAPDFSPWRLWTAVALEDRAMWMRELEGLLVMRAGPGMILTPARARLDPLLTPIRNDPEFESILSR